MARTSGGSAEEALAGMARIGAPRQPMGNAPFQAKNASATDTGSATLKGKNNKQSGDPTAPGTAKARSAVSAESSGACYAIKTSIHPVGPVEASATQANGRKFSPAINRTATEFGAGAAAVRSL